MANPSNLLPILYQTKLAVGTSIAVKLAFLNICLFKNKSLLVNDLITTNNLDFMFLNETWLEDSCSATVLNETAPPNFTFLSVCRGSGVAARFKNVYQCKQVSLSDYLSFEFLGIVLKCLGAGRRVTKVVRRECNSALRILFIIIYRPPKYSPAFVKDFTELLSMISSEFDCFSIAGYFNIHIDNADINTA